MAATGSFSRGNGNMTFSGKTLFPAFLVFSTAFSTLAMAAGQSGSVDRTQLASGRNDRCGRQQHRSEPFGGSRRIRIVSDRCERRIQGPWQCKRDRLRPAGTGRAGDPANQFHPVSRKVHARHFVQSQLEGVQSTDGPRLVSRRAHPVHRSGYRQAAVGCEPDRGSVRCQSRQQPADLGGPSGAPRRPQPGKYSGTYTRDQQSRQLHRHDLAEGLEFHPAGRPGAQVLLPVLPGRHAGRAARTAAQQDFTAVHQSGRPAPADEGARFERDSDRTLQRRRCRPLLHVAGAFGEPVQGPGGRAAARPDALRLQRRRDRPLHQPLSHHQAVGQQHAPGRHQEPDLDVADSRPVQRRHPAPAVPPWTSGFCCPSCTTTPRRRSARC